jgi:hypothetical protein
MITPKIPDFSTHNFKECTSRDALSLDGTMKYHKCAHCGLIVFESSSSAGLLVSAHTFEEKGKYHLSPEDVTCEEWARYCAIRYVIT